MKSAIFCTVSVLFFSFQLFAQENYTLCEVPKTQLSNRHDFLMDLNMTHNKDLRKLKSMYDEARGRLDSMEFAHAASDVAQTVSAVAGLVAGGAAISTLYFSGGSVTALGFTVKSGSVAAHVYSGYAIGSNLATLGQVGYNLLQRGESPEDLLARQMKDLEQKGLFSKEAVKFLSVPNWSGWSQTLQNPDIQNAFKVLQKFYEKKVKELDDNGGWWSYVGEFWHEKGLKRAALDVAVFKESMKLQKLRIEYFETMKKLLLKHYRHCYM